MPAKQITELERLRKDNQALKDAEAKTFSKLRAAEKELQAVKRDNITAEEIREDLYGLSKITGDPPKWLWTKRPHGAPGVPMLFLSDWHWGEVVDPIQVGGVNKFNRSIAKLRVQ